MLTPEELEENRLMSLKVCENSYLMYEDSKKEMIEVAAKKTDKNGAPIYTEQAIKKNLQLIETAQKDIIQKYIQLGGNEDDLKNLKKKTKKTVNRKALQELMKKETAKDEMAKYIADMRSKDIYTSSNNDTTQMIYKPEEEEKPEETVIEKETIGASSTQITREEMEAQLKELKNQIDSYNSQVEQVKQPIVAPNYETSGNKMYDVIKLPSKGQCYRNKKDRIKVGYLTAFDENMILSPNLYKDGKFVDYLLQSKILENDINSEDLTKGDRDAIILWLRATGYGNDYPIIVTDDETGREFETTIDLSTLKYKPFSLKGDENGYFDFEMPSTKDIIKFKFLTLKDMELLNKLKNEENKKINVFNIRQLCTDLTDTIKDNDLISYNTQQKVKSTVELIREDLNKNYDEENDLTFSHELTDRLLLQTVSINGITDRKYIENYIFRMNVKDAAVYRKYILDNEPGVDFNVEVERPESLGGGSIKSFLRLDQFIFINI